MEEDIKHLEKRIDLNRQMYLEFGRLLSLDEETVNAIENLINKNKELEKVIEQMQKEIIQATYMYKKEIEEQQKMIELMAEAFKQDDIRSKEEIIVYFRKKAKGE